jgi:oxygen-independent coproporphyrinogen III oxidase
MSSILSRMAQDNNRSQFNESGPYYTSYPTLGLWSNEYDNSTYVQSLEELFREHGDDVPLALYVHVPFCAKLCWYCICNIKISNNRDRIQEFTDYLTREVRALAACFKTLGVKPNFEDIHLGGGTPSHLDNEQFAQLMDSLGEFIDLDSLEELAMEIDPRTTSQENLHYFADKGVTRISFGVQDFDAGVQEAINRVQPVEMVTELLSPDVRDRFTGVNFDLLYGLPRQTRETFRNTVELVKQIGPERITLLKYAHVPDVRKHMKLIKEDDLPPVEDLPLMFTETVEAFLGAGYEWIGIDNFAKKGDKLANAVKSKTLGRDFNGWNTGRSRHLLGLGPTTTSAFGRYYYQSVYSNKEYYEALDGDMFPILRGFQLTDDDLIRRDVMFSILCKQEIVFAELDQKHRIDFTVYFADELEHIINRFTDEGLVEVTGDKITISAWGRFFSRNICRVFDKYWKDKDYKITGP